MRRRVALPILLAGCAELLGIHDPTRQAAGDDDAGPSTIDAAAGAFDARAADAQAGADARTCGYPFVPSRVDPCDLPDANDVTTIGDAVLDTEQGTLKIGEQPIIELAGGERTQSGGLRFRLEHFTALTITGHLVVKGRPALVLFVDGDLRVAAGGALDLSPVRDADGSSGPAPGGDDTERCGNAGRGGEGEYGASQTAGSGGGGGGAHGGGGGPGGRGGADNGGKGGKGGTVNGETGPLRGGCRGGAVEGAALIGSDAGFGGGAVQLSVAGRLIVEAGARIDASGAGGTAAHTVFGTIDGGGGGGSGGTIFIEAAAIEVYGALCANGGGGGESHGSDGGQHGASGQCANAPAPGGASSGGGANGGDGGYRDHPDGMGGAMGFGVDGGGGGGGGVGRIQLRSVAPAAIGASAVVTPTPESAG